MNLASCLLLEYKQVHSESIVSQAIEPINETAAVRCIQAILNRLEQIVEVGKLERGSPSRRAVRREGVADTYLELAAVFFKFLKSHSHSLTQHVTHTKIGSVHQLRLQGKG